MLLKGKIILITGGGSGIGLESVKHFLAEGLKVIICGRHGEKLRKVKQQFSEVIIIECDLTQLPDVYLLIQLVNSIGGIDILYHNAAVVNEHDLLGMGERSLTIARQEMETNYLAPVLLTSLLLPQLLLRKSPVIIFTTSAVAYLPAGFIATYSASKAALHSYVLSLRYQLKLAEQTVRVTELIPPTVDTETTRHFNAAKVSTTDVVQALIRGLKSDKETIHVSIAKPFYFLHRFFPSMAFKIVNSKNPIR